MNDRLSNYFKNFNERLTDDLGSTFDYPALISYGKKKRGLLVLPDEPIEIPWIGELSEIVEKIKAIVNNVNPQIDPEMTFKNSEFDTFEDRYIVFLIDQISSVLAGVSSRVASLTRTLGDYYIHRHIPFGELARLSGASALNNGNLIQLKEERQLLQLRETLGKLMDTNYYIMHKKCSLFDDECVCVTDILRNEPLYKECFEYYDTLKEIVAIHYDLPLKVRNIDYQNYAFLALLLAFDERGFTLNGKSPDFDNKDYLLRIKNLRLVRKNIVVTINADSDDHVDLLFEDNKDYLQKGKKQSKVSIDLYPYFNKHLSGKEEATTHFRKKINYRFKSGFDNAFILTAIPGSQNDHVIIVSPSEKAFDANLSNMIESCLLFLAGDNFTYSHFCPVCGGHVETNQQNDYHCSVCGSVYTLLTDKDKKETIWVKRLNNLEGK